MVAAYTTISFPDFVDYQKYVQDNTKLPAGKLITAFYSNIDGMYVVLQQV